MRTCRNVLALAHLYSSESWPAHPDHELESLAYCSTYADIGASPQLEKVNSSDEVQEAGYTVRVPNDVNPGQTFHVKVAQVRAVQ